jgi:hypothetical protein
LEKGKKSDNQFFELNWLCLRLKEAAEAKKSKNPDFKI